MKTTIKPEPGLLVPCPTCGAPLSSYYDPATGEEFYCPACAPACPNCGKKMVSPGEPGAAGVCLDCTFWELTDGPAADDNHAA